MEIVALLQKVLVRAVAAGALALSVFLYRKNQNTDNLSPEAMRVLWQKVVREGSYEMLGFWEKGISLGKSDFYLKIKYIFSDADKME